MKQKHTPPPQETLKQSVMWRQFVYFSKTNWYETPTNLSLLHKKLSAVVLREFGWPVVEVCDALKLPKSTYYDSAKYMISFMEQSIYLDLMAKKLRRYLSSFNVRYNKLHLSK